MNFTTAKYCLFCNEPEKDYKPRPGIEFICSCCVLLLVGADQADLKRAYQKALSKVYFRKALALESFIIREGKHGRRPNKSIERNLNRKRTTRSLRNQKRLSQPVEA